MWEARSARRHSRFVQAVSLVTGGVWGVKFWDCMWPRDFLFRLVLLASTACVATEALLGVTCPLTTLENHLLLAAGKSAYNRSFIGNVTHGVLFYDAPEWVFTIIYWLLT